MNLKARLLEIIKEKSYEEGKFILASGKLSNFYIDCRETSLDAEGAYLIGKLFYQIIRESSVSIDGVGGMTLGADPLACATSLISYLEGDPISAFIIRKEAKKHGKDLWIEGKGNLKEGAPVAIVEDVVTTGKTILKAIERAREEDLVVKMVLALIDREEGGREKLSKAGFDLKAIFIRKDIVC
jgi:orotate phosphoribosyltransferase